MIDNYITHILPSLQHVHAWGYWMAFFAALIETTLGIGLLLPGSTIILFLGALSARGYLDTGDLIWFALLGAVLGDNINYKIGSKYAARWVDKGFWFLKSEHTGKVKKFMSSHGSKSVFLGRFIPSVKEIIPFVAGSVNMNKKTFLFWNVLGAIGWACEWVLAGYIFVQSISLAEFWLSRAGLFFSFLAIFGIILYFIKWLIIKNGKYIPFMAASLWRSIKKAGGNNKCIVGIINKHPRSVSFLRARLDTNSFSGLTLSMLTLAFIYVLVLFAGIVEDLITSDPIISADHHIANLFAHFRTDTLTHVFSWITFLGNSRVIMVFTAIFVTLLWLWRKSDYILPLFISVIGSETFTFLGKLAFHRPRTVFAVYQEYSFSFPSGHATIAVAFYGFAGYILLHYFKSWRKRVNIFFATGFLIISIGLSRLYLGAHYISDVWSGYLMGAMWLIIAVSVSEWFRFQQADKKHLLPVSGVQRVSLVLIFTAILFYAGFSINYRPSLAPVLPVKTVTVSKTTDIFSNEQMKYTETIIGEKQEPLNFIFLAENNDQLVAAFQQAEWVLSDNANISSFFKAVKSVILKMPHPSGPLSPSFWNTKIQNMSFTKVSGNTWFSNAHHIKIWRTNYSMKSGKIIYVGMANANDGLKWGIIPQISDDLDSERKLLYRDLRRADVLIDNTIIQLVNPLIGKNFIGEQFFTDGKVYIITMK